MDTLRKKGIMRFFEASWAVVELFLVGAFVIIMAICSRKFRSEISRSLF
jgi:hypothetical protein